MYFPYQITLISMALTSVSLWIQYSLASWQILIGEQERANLAVQLEIYIYARRVCHQSTHAQ